MATPAQRVVSGLWFAVVLARLAFLGQHGAHLRAQLNEQRAKLAVALAEVERLVGRDDLTAVMNRRAIMAMVGEERERMRRTGMPFAVALFDIDFFKRVNDERGHLVGDEVLRRFCAAAGGSDPHHRPPRPLRRRGIPGADAGHRQGRGRARRRRAGARRGRQGRLERRRPGLEVTVSAGVAIATAEDTVEALLGRADMALYAAKHEGRNRVRSA